LDPAKVTATLEAQIAKGRALLKREGVALASERILHFADMQFQGQSHLLTVQLPSTAITREDLQARFEAAYWERFEVALPEIRAVLVNLHTALIGQRRALDLAVLGRSAREDTLKKAQSSTRAVWFDGRMHETPIYQREQLPLDSRFTGPAIIEQLDCTTVIEPGNQVTLDHLGNLRVQV
jgi:N-methylhydantoinase A